MIQLFVNVTLSNDKLNSTKKTRMILQSHLFHILLRNVSNRRSCTLSSFLAQHEMIDVWLLLAKEHMALWLFYICLFGFFGGEEGSLVFFLLTPPFVGQLRSELNPFKRLCPRTRWLLRLLSSERKTLTWTKNNRGIFRSRRRSAFSFLRVLDPWAALFGWRLSPNQFSCITWPTLSGHSRAGQNSPSSVSGIT